MAVYLESCLMLFSDKRSSSEPVSRFCLHLWTMFSTAENFGTLWDNALKRLSEQFNTDSGFNSIWSSTKVLYLNYMAREVLQLSVTRLSSHCLLHTYRLAANWYRSNGKELHYEAVIDLCPSFCRLKSIPMSKYFKCSRFISPGLIWQYEILTKARSS
jgi:hypothetical protein